MVVQMFVRNVCHHPDFIGNTEGAVLGERMAGRFEHKPLYPGLFELSNALLQERCRSSGHVKLLGSNIIPNPIANGGHKSCFVASISQHTVNHTAGGGLAIRAGDPNHVHAPRREAIANVGSNCHRTVVFGLQESVQTLRNQLFNSCLYAIHAILQSCLQ